jgi:hypothetical protein
VRSCSSHIATSVSRDFDIDPDRMLFVEYFEEVLFGRENERRIPERFEAVDFTWHEGMAIKPKYRSLRPPLRLLLEQLVDEVM